MANDPGVDSFFGTNYAKMLDALDKVGDPNRAAILRGGRSGVFTDVAKSPQINIPNWNGIIRTGPRPQLTADDWTVQRAAERAGTASPLSADVQGEIARRRDFARNIPQSATPEYMGGLSQFINAVDNVQDFAATIAFGGRLALGAAEYGLNRLAPGAAAALAAEAGAAAGRAAGLAAGAAFDRALLELGQLAAAGDTAAARALAGTLAERQAAIAAAEKAAFASASRLAALGLGSRILARFVPFLGTALLAIDLLNLLTRIAVWLGPGYALACAGPRDALAALAVPFMNQAFFKGIGRLLPRKLGVPALRADKGNKSKVGRAAARQPGGRKGFAPSASKLGALSPSFADAIQAGQVGADWAGRGIALGGIVGAMSDTAFSTARGAASSGPGRRSPKLNHDYAAMIGPRLAGLRPSALWHRELAARTLATVPLILAAPEVAGDDLYVLAWIAAYCAIEPVQWEQAGLPWRDLVAAGSNARWFGYPVRDEGSREAVAAFGFDPDGLSPWPLRGNRLEITPADYLDDLGPRVAAGLLSWCAKDPDSPLTAFVCELSGAYTERAWVWLSGEPDWPRWKLSPDVGVLESLLRANVWPVISDDLDRIYTAWDECRRTLADAGRAWLTQDELEAIFERHGSPLLRLLPPDAPLPAAWALPHDEVTGLPGDMVAADSLREAQALALEWQQHHGTSPR
jgi:hypothetical protein